MKSLADDFVAEKPDNGIFLLRCPAHIVSDTYWDTVSIDVNGTQVNCICINMNLHEKKAFFNHYRRSDILPLSTRPLLSLNFKWSVLNMRSEIYTFTLRVCNQQIPCQVHLAISITLLNFRLHWRRPSTTFWIQALVPSRNSSLNLFYAEALFAFFKGLPKYYRSFLLRISCILWAMG